MKKRTKIIILIIVIVSVIAFLFPTILKVHNFFYPGIYSRDKETKQYEKEAEKIAISYIEDKYNFSPTITGFDCNYEMDSVFELLALSKGTFTGMTEVFMTYNNVDFSTFVHIYKDNDIDISDSYQAKEIKRDIMKYYNSLIDITPKNYSVMYTDIYYKYTTDENYYSKYYDGDIESFLKEIKPKITIEFIDEDDINSLQSIPSNKVFGALNILNYRDSESYERLSNGSITFKFKDDYFNNFKSIKSAITYRDGQVNYYSYDYKEFDDICYILLNPDDSINITKEKITDTELEQINQKSSNNYEYKPSYNCFVFEGTLTDKMYIFVPTDPYKKEHNDRLFLNNNGSLSELSKDTYTNYYKIELEPGQLQLKIIPTKYETVY